VRRLLLASGQPGEPTLAEFAQVEPSQPRGEGFRCSDDVAEVADAIVPGAGRFLGAISAASRVGSGRGSPRILSGDEEFTGRIDQTRPRRAGGGFAGAVRPTIATI
jgi:hypothetical protein